MVWLSGICSTMANTKFRDSKNEGHLTTLVERKLEGKIKIKV